MGFTSLLIHLLAVGISTTVALDGPVVPARPTKTTLTVDCLWCTGTEVFDTSFTTSIQGDFSWPGFPPEISKTTICAQKCSVLTLSTVTWKSGMSKASPFTPSAVSTSCVTIYNDTPIPSLVTLSSTTASTSCSTTSEEMMVSWEWVTPSSSSSIWGIPPGERTWTLGTPIGTPIWSQASSFHFSQATDEASGSEPCTTELTVTMTKTITETWQSQTPMTTILVRTRSTTIETVVVETYSTSTGERVVGGTRTETTTVQAVSSGKDCVQVGKCCAACSATVAPGESGIASILSVGSASTDEEYVSSSEGSISWTSGSLTPNSTEDSVFETTTETGWETGSDVSETDSEWSSGSETDVPTSIQTAGGAQVTAALGIGVVLGLMGLLA
ncbi:hypothetical protein BHE90_011279 [Fusarium euwallaceae]|uniref:Ig-like domain-containing protein n=4 Tax=Fusarium solani species complex TaxID=232080 RepID=A0A428U716_9HYPO|nr:hypothetical protein CEP51_012346 [Fusarium floridanum]RSM08094.1 hypothetical protein CDV31_008307 [Fusarium ambrosium]RSM10092.1 hypothetical protein CEP52_003721 [Fusarium oligoseptatum]RTE74276.1 hypothetical protein BHE90_011279 [Fusarium euwallaceae]